MSQFAEAFKHELRAARKERKSDEIVVFMRSHCKLFGVSRAKMDNLCEELEQRGDLTPSALASVLYLHEGVLFKKVKVVDTAKTLLDLRRSQLYKTFKELPRVMANKDTYLVAVAGERTLVLTNRPVKQCTGLVEIRIMEEDGTCTTVIPAEDAPLRLPSVFGIQETD